MGGGRVSLASLFRMILLTAIAALAVGYGLRVREWAWRATDGVHFRGDISAGWAWGDRAMRRGLFTFYDDLEEDLAAGEFGVRKNDYPPLRLSVMTAWNRWTRQHYPDADSWLDDYDFTAPVLHVNTTAELLSAALVFAIIFTLKRRMNGVWSWQGATAGLFGGLLFWFNPAILWDSHCWPQWDVWCLPFFFAAILATCLNSWFLAGAMIAVGSFFKGQLLLVAPIFLLWPLFMFNFSGLFRFFCGFVVMTAVVALPWMNLQTKQIVWLASVFAAMLLFWVPRFVSKPGKDRINQTGLENEDELASESLPRFAYKPGHPVLYVAVIGVAFLIAWPWASDAGLWIRWLVRFPLLFALIATVCPRVRWPLTAVAFAIAVLLTIPLFDASTAWFRLGFVYGTQKFENMFTGSGSWNVPAMLVEYLGWNHGQDPDNSSNVVRLWIVGWTVSVHTMMRGLYAATLICCAVAAAIQSYRRDTRLLVALATPWLTMFLLMPQMHGRYSVWAAGACALLAAESVGLALLGLLISVVAMLGIVENQSLFRRDYWPELLDLLQRVDPHLGWVFIVMALILMYVALLPRRRTGRCQAEAVLQHQEIVEVD